MKRHKNKKAYIIFLSIFIGLGLLIVGFNIWFTRISLDNEKYHLVEINEAVQVINAGNKLELDDNYRYIVGYESVAEELIDDSFLRSVYAYEVRLIGEDLYRFDYQMDMSSWQQTMRRTINMMFLFVFILLLYAFYDIWKNMLHPFEKIEQMPYDLSKGILSEGIKEEKTKYFGKFLWGLDLLRDKLETQKKEELKLQKEKKTLILSISHDIKTPLSAIKLYTKALENNLYHSAEEQKEVICNITKHAEEIEAYVSQIVKASREDFLNLDVDMNEIFLFDFVNRVSSFYRGKLELLRIPFSVNVQNNYLLKGDIDRLEEIVQNVIENAIKYGDGEQITIEQSEEEYCCLITITNTGCTLKEEELPHIFDEFWRGSNVRAEEGSGLGLYICKELIHKMGGDIYARVVNEEMQVTIVIRMV